MVKNKKLKISPVIEEEIQKIRIPPNQQKN